VPHPLVLPNVLSVVGHWHAICSTSLLAILDLVSTAERDILRYLLSHKDARDTIAGIEQWWLPQSREYGVAEISAALLRLERRGLIAIWKSVSAQPLYSLPSGGLTRPLEEYLRTLE
jgi:hypothetical protein